MSLRLAMVVPVAAVADDRAQWDRLAHRYIPLAHARAQAALGNEVHVFFDGPRGRYEIEPGVTVHVSGRAHRRGGALRSPHLVLAAERLRPDVLHLHHLLSLESLSVASRRVERVFAEYHGGAPPRWAAKRRMLRWVSQRVEGAFFAARHYRDMLVRAGAWSREVPCIVSPETTSRVSAQRPRPVEGEGVRVLVVGRCESPKDPDATLAALEAMVQGVEGLQVRWASPGGAQRDRVRAELRSSRALADRVQLASHPAEAMPELYAWADVLLVTSEREIGGTVLSEALAQGTPVAAFYLPTFEALAGDCPAVRLVRPRDPARLATEALELARQPNLREVARGRFESALSFSAIAAARDAVYRRAVQGADLLLR